MPTSRRRFSVTETDEIARALDVAAVVWPQDAANRSVLLRRLVELGSARATELTVDRRAVREAAVRETAGIVRGVYPRSGAGAPAEEWSR
ncbi:MAG TPA: hypothetical protein VJR25_13850 [Microbacterium sp.]|uniref:hypothetical protein n=1 Tax=Microbacterium sp. TaxID=51671 RepID=UPI002B492EEF|nr:hypothetical protein [Microbacterium sp.]HKT57846.1 hypothetical protein [Microbacterium sp.]